MRTREGPKNTPGTPEYATSKYIRRARDIYKRGIQGGLTHLFAGFPSSPTNFYRRGRSSSLYRPFIPSRC